MHESELYAMETEQAAHASQVACRRADQTLRAAIQEAAAEAAKQALHTAMQGGSGARDLRHPDGRGESGSNPEPAALVPGAQHGALLEPTDLLLRAVMSEQDSWLERWRPRWGERRDEQRGGERRPYLPQDLPLNAWQMPTRIMPSGDYGSRLGAPRAPVAPAAAAAEAAAAASIEPPAAGTDAVAAAQAAELKWQAQFNQSMGATLGLPLGTALGAALWASEAATLRHDLRIAAQAAAHSPPVGVDSVMLHSSTRTPPRMPTALDTFSVSSIPASISSIPASISSIPASVSSISASVSSIPASVQAETLSLWRATDQAAREGTATTTSLTYASLNANRSRYMQQRLEGGFQDHLGKSLGKSTKEPITPLFVLPAGLSPLPEMPDYVAAQPTEGDLLY